jgi:hypothetical protein
MKAKPTAVSIPRNDPAPQLERAILFESIGERAKRSIGDIEDAHRRAMAAQLRETSNAISAGVRDLRAHLYTLKTLGVAGAVEQGDVSVDALVDLFVELAALAHTIPAQTREEDVLYVGLPCPICGKTRGEHGVVTRVERPIGTGKTILHCNNGHRALADIEEREP